MKIGVGSSIEQHGDPRWHLLFAEIEDASHRDFGKSEEPKGSITSAGHRRATKSQTRLFERLNIIAKGTLQGIYGHVYKPALEDISAGEVTIGNPLIGNGNTLGPQQIMEQKHLKPLRRRDGNARLLYPDLGEVDEKSAIEERELELPFIVFSTAFGSHSIGADPFHLLQCLFQGDVIAHTKGSILQFGVERKC